MGFFFLLKKISSVAYSRMKTMAGGIQEWVRPVCYIKFAFSQGNFRYFLLSSCHTNLGFRRFCPIFSFSKAHQNLKKTFSVRGGPCAAFWSQKCVFSSKTRKFINIIFVTVDCCQFFLSNSTSCNQSEARKTISAQILI